MDEVDLSDSTASTKQLSTASLEFLNNSEIFEPVPLYSPMNLAVFITDKSYQLGMKVIELPVSKNEYELLRFLQIVSTQSRSTCYIKLRILFQKYCCFSNIY